MCGIVGYIGAATAVDVLVPALKRLEYRGYDSAGVATVNGHGLEIRKALGKIANLEAQFNRSGPPAGTLGIAHTRWATHGRPCEANAHPHVDCETVSRWFTTESSKTTSSSARRSRRKGISSDRRPTRKSSPISSSPI